MNQFLIEGGIPLSGTVRVQGAKNAALPILAATVLADGEFLIEDVPCLTDMAAMLTILRELGIEARKERNSVTIDTRGINATEIPERLMGKMRSSIFLMGPLLGRFGEVRVSQPGGCDIGERRIDLHVRGLEQMGATIQLRGGELCCQATKLRGSHIYLDYPSVGATENLMMAAVLAEGETVIQHAAKEPEIVDLQNFLTAMGAKIRGAGTDTIVIQGVEKVTPLRYCVIPDRIVAGTLMIAAAMTRGDVWIQHVNPGSVDMISQILLQIGNQVEIYPNEIHVKGVQQPRSISKITTSPYPGFPTDMQPQMMAYLSICQGTSIIKENVFESRLRHVNELNRMGANIYTDLSSAFIRGVEKLSGATVEAFDLRAGAGLVLAGLVAEGVTRVRSVHHIDRGYEELEKVLASLGANISRELVD